MTRLRTGFRVRVLTQRLRWQFTPIALRFSAMEPQTPTGPITGCFHLQGLHGNANPGRITNAAAGV